MLGTYDHLKSWFLITVFIQKEKEVEERRFKIFASNVDIAIKVVFNKFEKETKKVEIKSYKKL